MGLARLPSGSHRWHAVSPESGNDPSQHSHSNQQTPSLTRRARASGHLEPLARSPAIAPTRRRAALRWRPPAQTGRPRRGPHRGWRALVRERMGPIRSSVRRTVGRPRASRSSASAKPVMTLTCARHPCRAGAKSPPFTRPHAMRMHRPRRRPRHAPNPGANRPRSSSPTMDDGWGAPSSAGSPPCVSSSARACGSWWRAPGGGRSIRISAFMWRGTTPWRSATATALP